MTQSTFTLSRRLFFRKAAQSAAVVAVAAAPAVAEPKPQIDGHVPADDMVPRFREVRELVDKLELRGYMPRLQHGRLFIWHPEDGKRATPNTALARLRAYDRQTVADYLEITGRVSA